MSDKLQFVANVQMHYRRSDKLKFVDDKLKFVGHRSFDVSYQNILSIEDEPTIKRQPVIAHQPHERRSSVGLALRKRNSKRAAPARSAIKINGTIVSFRHPFGYREPQSASPI